MENKNYTIFFHVFVCKTKYPIHIIYVTIPRGDNNGGMETKGTSKFDGTLAMKKTSLPILKSCKVEQKLLLTSKTMQNHVKCT